MNEQTKTVTEKRFFEWVEDDVSVTLRSKSGSYGGGPRFWLFAVDLYNGTITGNVTMTLCCERSDPHHLPCVVLIRDES